MVIPFPGIMDTVDEIGRIREIVDLSTFVFKYSDRISRISDTPISLHKNLSFGGSFQAE